MTVGILTTGREEITGDGVTARVDLSFQFTDENQLSVFVTDTDGDVTYWTYQQSPGDWYFTGGDGETGSVFFDTADLPTGDTLTVKHVAQYDQPYSFPGAIDVSTISAAFDHLAMNVQALASEVAYIQANGVSGGGGDISLLAPLASPTFTGVPRAPTAAPGTDSTQIATTAFCQALVVAAATGLTEASLGFTIGKIPVFSSISSYPGLALADTTFIQRTTISSEDNGADLKILRDASSVSGGTAGYVNTALRVQTLTGAGQTSYEWAFLAEVTNISVAGENVAGYLQAKKQSSGPTWGGVIEIRDENNADPTTSIAVGLEISAASVAGSDPDLNRNGIDIAMSNIPGTGVAEWGRGYRISGQTTTRVRQAFANNAKYTDAVYYNNGAAQASAGGDLSVFYDEGTDAAYGINLQQSSYSSAAIGLKEGGKLSFEATNGAHITYSSAALNINGAPVILEGDLTVGGDLVVTGSGGPGGVGVPTELFVAPYGVQVPEDSFVSFEETDTVKVSYSSSALRLTGANVVVGSTLTVGTGLVVTTGGMTISGGTLTVGTIDCTSSLGAAALAVTNNATVGGTLGVTSNATVGGTLSVTSTITSSNRITAGSAGLRVPTNAPVNLSGGGSAYFDFDGTNIAARGARFYPTSGLGFAGAQLAGSGHTTIVNSIAVLFDGSTTYYVPLCS